MNNAHLQPGKGFDSRQNILTAARHVIAGKGFSAVGISEILQEANAVKGSRSLDG
ncbi:TetR family transcriptional regulator [Collimonas sp. OK307]|uniref:TetR family transcriptional regulator n=1 Tax=Collimonas sp. OK307 TaxID=1801620 RepID=UPI000B878718|nr:TetR family transcriptional regulator [Collimonas sp. OK307]